MEEKVLVKGLFSNVIIPIIAWVLGALSFVIFALIDDDLIASGVLFALIFLAIGFIALAILKKRQMIVTNKRVIARGAFGCRVDLPIEKVTSTSIYIFNGIGCASPSKRIRFFFCKNKIELFDTIASEVLQRDSKYQ